VEYAKPSERVHCAVYSRKLGCEIFGASSSEDYADMFLTAEAILKTALHPHFLRGVNRRQASPGAKMILLLLLFLMLLLLLMLFMFMFRVVAVVAVVAVAVVVVVDVVLHG